MKAKQEERGTVTVARTGRAEPAPADEAEVAPRSGGMSRLVVWAGVMLGTALVALITWGGGHPRVGGMPRWAGYVAGFLIMSLVITGLSVWAAALLRTHHRAMARWSWRTTRRAAVAGYQGTRRHGGRARQRLGDWAGPRWAGRGDTWRRPLTITRRQEEDAGGEGPPEDHDPGPGPGEQPPGAAGGPGQNGDSDMSDMSDMITEAVRKAWCGDGDPAVRTTRTAPGEYVVSMPPGVINPEVMAADPDRRAERALARAIGAALRVTRLRRTRDGVLVTIQVRPAAAPGPATTAGAPAPAASTNGGTTMPDARPQAQASVPAHWKGLATATADFHPGSDAELLEWMSSEVAGMLGYGEAVAEVHEHCLTSVRADPAAMAALHDVADAAADCAEAMARAMEKFKQVYEAPREFVGDGGVLPKDGDWLHGDD